MVQKLYNLHVISIELINTRNLQVPVLHWSTTFFFGPDKKLASLAQR